MRQPPQPPARETQELIPMSTFIGGGVTAARGFSAAGIHCGIRKNRSKKDLALIFSCLLYTSPSPRDS